MVQPAVERATGTAVPPGDDPATEAPDRQRDRRPLLRHPIVGVVGLFVLLFVLCAPIVALQEHRAHPLFILDEFAYADYLHKVDDGHLFIRRGELTGQATLRELACRGYSPDIWKERPACDSPSFNAADFPNAGIDSADIHPPTYFILTDLGAHAIMAVGISHNLINAGRLFGAAWMAAGLCALWYLLRALRVNRWAGALALGLVAASPSLRWEWYYLTPDAANILVGSLVVLAALHWERSAAARSRWGLALLAGAGAMALAFKAPNIIVVAAAALYLLVRALVSARTSRPDHEAASDGAGPPTDPPADGAVPGLTPKRYVVAAASLLGGAAAMAAGWLVVRTLTALPGGASPMAQSLSHEGIGMKEIVANLGRFITVWDLTEAQSYPFALVTSYVLLGSLVAGLAAYGWRRREHALAMVTGAMVIVGPLLLVATTYVTTGSYFLAEARYGATLVPLECAVAAGLWRSRAALIAVGALAVAYHVAVLLPLLHL